MQVGRLTSPQLLVVLGLVTSHTCNFSNWAISFLTLVPVEDVTASTCLQ